MMRVMVAHDDWLLDGHDAGWDGQGCCPSCTARFEDCCCCPLCSGDGRIKGERYEICPACEGEGLLKPKADAHDDLKGPL